MKNNLQYPYAHNDVFDLISASIAEKSLKYSCIGCGNPMHLKADGSKKRKKHFAHAINVSNCAGETVLHETAKLLIKQSLSAAISNGLEYSFFWRCTVCCYEHFGNLAKLKPEILLEKEIYGKRPDILLVTPDKPIMAIEVVVSHFPEEDALNTYLINKLNVIIFRPSWDSIHELPKGLQEIEFPNAPCRTPKCPKCKKPLSQYDIGILMGYKCYHCSADMKLLVTTESCCDQWGLLEGPSFVSFANKHGVKMNRSAEHVCLRCNYRQGSYFNDKYFWLNDHPEISVSLLADYSYCGKCGWEEVVK